MTEDGKEMRERGRKWLTRIEAAWKAEEAWVKGAEKAAAAYMGDGADVAVTGATKYDFNILFSNVETIVPAIINSPPAPDIRRRFGDDDPVAKDVSEVIERAIRVQVDDGALQVVLEGAAQDAFLAGRGIARIRFEAESSDDPNDGQRRNLAEDAAEDDGGDSSDERTEATASDDIKGERVTFEAVSWRDFRRGPAKRWQDVPWIAFRHSVAFDDLEEFKDRALADAQTLPEDKVEAGDGADDVVMWEVWDKKSRTVLFIEHDTGRVLKQVDDPLGLSKFFPIITPLQPIELVGRLAPVTPFSIYRQLADELDLTTRRINLITEQMRVRGWYAGNAVDMQNMMEAKDVDFVPIADPEMWAQNGGLEGAVAFWPIDKFISVLRELYNAREQTKQAIYEITGISDIVRGATAASETATAQQIKTQWGSLRIQKMQRQIERAAREIFLMMAEVIPSKFTAKTLQDITSIQLIPTPDDLAPPQMPPANDNDPQAAQQAKAQFAQALQAKQAKLQHLKAVRELLGQRLTSFYRIDVETDSTIQADLTRQKAEVSSFLQAAGTYWQAVAPLVQQGQLPGDVAAEIFVANSRLFKLGKSTEDALERMIADARQKAQQPQPPSPETLKQQADAQKAQMDAQAAQQANRLEAMRLQNDRDKAEGDRQVKVAQIESQRRSEWDRAVLQALVAVVVARIGAKTDLDSQQLEQEFEAMLRMAEMQHEKVLTGMQGQQQAALSAQNASQQAPQAA